MGRTALAALLLLAPAAAHAHDLWLEPAGTGLALRYGHRGGEALALDAAKVKALRCHAPGPTRELLPAATFTPRALQVAGGCDAASASFDGGYWTLTPDGEVNRPRHEVEQPVKAWASRQFAKWVNARLPAATSAVLGDELELVLVGEVAAAREGDKVTVRVLSAGSAVPGAIVSIDHMAIGEADGMGEVRVRLRTAGVQTITASLRRPLASREADALVLEASLSFEAAK